MMVAAAAVLAALALSMPAGAQTRDAGSGPSTFSAHILLVLPFDNLTDNLTGSAAVPTNPAAPQPAGPAGSEIVQPGRSSLEWIGEAAPEILNSRFTSAGFFPLGREDRLYALDHLGLPETFEPSRATALRIAQTLDANDIIYGSYSTAGATLTIKAHIVDVARLRLSPEVTESGDISKLIPLLNSLAWQLTRQLDPAFNVAEDTFRAASSNLRLDAFEQYVRGITERDVDTRLKHLKKATDLSPTFTEAWLETGKLQFSIQQYEQAAVSFSKISRGDPSELEAGFYRGLSLLYSGSYSRAEDSFAAVARVLPLPEVVNNQAVAVSRRGQDASSLFRQAEAADPTDPDYHFNLALSLHKLGNKAEAATEMAECLKLRPLDSEARVLAEAWAAAPATPAQPTTNPPAPAAASSSSANASEPLERIKRAYDGAAFREAALMMDQMESASLAALPDTERAARLNKSASEKLQRGLLLEAERGYQAAISADDHNAEAHAGLAEVRERAGDNDSARTEAQASLVRQPNLSGYLVLARLDLAANRLTEARDEAGNAVRLDSTSRTARDLKKAIDTRIAAQSATESKPPAPVQPDAASKP